MKIEVLSRREIEEFKSEEKHIVISISDPNSERVKIISKPLDILSLQFHDVDKPLVKRENCKRCNGTGELDMFRDENDKPGSCYACTNLPGLKLFTDQDADDILEFISTHALDINFIIVHCEAGISRSAGVAGALSLIYNKDDDYYFKNFLPNSFVYRKIIKVALKKGFLNDS